VTAGAPSEGTLLTVWGAGGSAPTGDPRRCGFGGDTVCFELRRLGGEHPPLVIDLGSAAMNLGVDLARRAKASGKPIRAEVLIGHLHLDHVIGLPFFGPIYMPESRIGLRCAILPDPEELADRLAHFAAPPFFPVEPMSMDTVSCARFDCAAPFELGGFKVSSTPLNHPGGCGGFRIDGPDGAVCVIGDHEHGDSETDARVAALVEGAALMLYDGAYDDDEYDRYRGWGHSTWQAGLELAEAASVGRTLIYHHQPEHADDMLSAIDARVRARSNHAALARQNMQVLLRGGVAQVLDGGAAAAAC
jgi:phosphoribosyl 1,2-cyclic phosphodiesterase